MSYHIISYHITPHNIISCDIISYHIISHHIIFYHIISDRTISYHIRPHNIISYHIISYHITLYHITQCHINHTISYLTIIAFIYFSLPVKLFAADPRRQQRKCGVERISKNSSRAVWKQKNIISKANDIMSSFTKD